MLVYLNKIKAPIKPQEFEAEVRQICLDCHIKNPNWLMIIMYAESQLKLISNASGAYGYIQIIPSTARKDLHISMVDLKKLSWKAYLQYTKLYIQHRIQEQHGQAPRTAYELYQLIHFPKAYRKPDNYVLYLRGSEAYSGNAPLDRNQDGKVNVAEINGFIDGKCPLFFDKSVLLKAENPESDYYFQHYQLSQMLIAAGISTLAVFGAIGFKHYQLRGKGLKSR